MRSTKLQLPPEPLTRGLPSPDPRSLCPLSSTDFVEAPPPPEKIPWYATVDDGQHICPFTHPLQQDDDEQAL
jgi:hypothetical protein